MTFRQITIALLLIICPFVLFSTICVSDSDDDKPESTPIPCCFKHKTRDTVKTECYRMQGKDDAFPGYYCFDEKKEKFLEFEPGDHWAFIDGDDPVCKPTVHENIGPIPKTFDITEFPYERIDIIKIPTQRIDDK